MNYQQLLALFKETHLELQQRAARSVDTSLVIRNWLFGWYIVEFEQGGAERAELYGKRLIDKLSRELKTLGLKGISSTSLRQCRTFYLAYKKIGPAVPAQSSDARIALPEIQQTLVEVTLPRDSNIFASKYQLYLPSKEELKRQLEEAAGIKEHCENPDRRKTAMFDKWINQDVGKVL